MLYITNHNLYLIYFAVTKGPNIFEVTGRLFYDLVDSYLSVMSVLSVVIEADFVMIERAHRITFKLKSVMDHYMDLQVSKIVA